MQSSREVRRLVDRGMCASQGEHPRRVWAAIYSQPLFHDPAASSIHRLLHRLISGGCRLLNLCSQNVAFDPVVDGLL